MQSIGDEAVTRVGNPDELFFEVEQTSVRSADRADLFKAALEFLSDRDAVIKIDDSSQHRPLGMELRLGPLFVSAKRMLWDSVTDMLSLAVKVAASDWAGAGLSALSVFKKAADNIAVFGGDSPEFLVYTAMVHLNTSAVLFAQPNIDQLRIYLLARQPELAESTVEEAIEVLKRKHLIHCEGGVLRPSF